jgi:hypothetical protein
MSPETKQQALEQQRIMHRQRQKSKTGKWVYRLLNSRSSRYALLKTLLLLALILFVFALGYYFIGPIVSS